jgi:hypothetical protein
LLWEWSHHSWNRNFKIDLLYLFTFHHII